MHSPIEKDNPFPLNSSLNMDTNFSLIFSFWKEKKKLKNNHSPACGIKSVIKAWAALLSVLLVVANVIIIICTMRLAFSWMKIKQTSHISPVLFQTSLTKIWGLKVLMVALQQLSKLRNLKKFITNLSYVLLLCNFHQNVATIELKCSHALTWN